MDHNILIQNPAQEAIGQSGMQAIVVIEKAGGAFVYGKAPDQVVLGEILVRACLQSIDLICRGHQGSYFQMLAENGNSGE
jgi:hypothetical protein